MIRRCFPGFALLIAAVFAATPAFAGPPLLCFPFDIGSTKSLPMGTRGWESIDAAYDPSHLIGDTLALLTPQTPTVVRMETLRRATIYAAHHPKLAATLLDALEARAAHAEPNVGYAVFDFGYLVETYKQAGWIAKDAPAFVRAKSIDGYMLVQKAQTLTNDRSMAFALVAMAVDKTHGTENLRSAVADAREAAKTDASVRANLASHWTETTSQF